LTVASQGVAANSGGGIAIAFRVGVLRPLLATALVSVLATACGFDPSGDSPMDPPAIYREWWARTESCSGLTADFDRVRWSVIPGYSFPCASGHCAGHWEPSHEIYLAGDWTMNEMVVRHEMLHDLLQRGGHPNPPFGQGCPLTWDTWKAGADQSDLAQSIKPID